jgi:hypothetical protein
LAGGKSARNTVREFKVGELGGESASTGEGGEDGMRGKSRISAGGNCRERSWRRCDCCEFRTLRISAEWDARRSLTELITSVVVAISVVFKC